MAGDAAASELPALDPSLVEQVQQTRAENYFASIEVLHRVLAEEAPSGTLSADKVIEVAEMLGLPLEVQPDEAMETAADGTVDAWEFESWWKRQWMRSSTAQAWAAAGFESGEVNHLAVAAGDRVSVLNNSDADWWLCSLGDSEGWVPARGLRVHGDASGSDSDGEYVQNHGSDTDSDSGSESGAHDAAAAEAIAELAGPQNAGACVLGGAGVVWRHPSFLDALADPIAAPGRRGGLRALLETMRLVGCCLAPNSGAGQTSLVQEWAPDVQRCWHDGTALTESLSQCGADMSQLHAVLESWMNRVHSLRKDGAPAIFPVAWRREHANEQLGTAMLGVLSKVDSAQYSLTVCSSGSNQGTAEYLATSPDTAHGGNLTRARSVTIESIPASRIEDSTLWFLLFRPAVFSNPSNGPELLFERVLPYLAERPLLRNTHGRLMPIPAGGDPSQWGGAVEALRCALLTQGSPAANSCEVLLHARLLQLALLDVSVMGTISDSDSAMLRLSCRTVAGIAAAEGRREEACIATEELEAVEACLTELEQGIAMAEPDTTPPPLKLSKEASVAPEHVKFSGFGRFRSDTSVEDLAGPAAAQPIVLPLPFARVPDQVTSPEQATSALRAVYELCVLIENQQQATRDSYLHRASIIRHLFTRVIPLPLPVRLTSTCSLVTHFLIQSEKSLCGTGQSPESGQLVLLGVGGRCVSLRTAGGALASAHQTG